MTLTVSGVYQDATSGGYTAKLGGKVTSGAVSYIFYADVGPGVDVDAVASDYAQRFPSSTVFPMARYASQTLSYVTGALRGAALVSCVMGIGVATLITVLFLRLRLTRDRRQHGVLSALGFSGRELAAQLLSKTLLCVVAGALAGVLFTVTAGERLAGAAISAAGMGITQLAFVPSPPRLGAVPAGAGRLRRCRRPPDVPCPAPRRQELLARPAVKGIHAAL